MIEHLEVPLVEKGTPRECRRHPSKPRYLGQCKLLCKLCSPCGLLLSVEGLLCGRGSLLEHLRVDLIMIKALGLIVVNPKST